LSFFFFQAEDGIRDGHVTGVQTCALPFLPAGVNRTVPGSIVSHAGSVRFTPAGSGTRIDVSLQYDPPGGTLAHTVASFIGADAGRLLEHDLQEFKQALESGRLAA